MSFTPCNRHMLLKPAKMAEEQNKATILVPEEYSMPKSRHQVYEVLSMSNDCEKLQDLVKEKDYVVVDNSMVEEIKVSGTTFHLVLENYIYGVIEDVEREE